MWKSREKFFTGRKHLERLIADFGDAPSHSNIVIVAEHASEGEARKIAGSGLLPGGNHACVQPARKRHADSLVAGEVALEIPGENLAQRLIVGFRLEFLLRFPFARVKVGRSLFKARV